MDWIQVLAILVGNYGMFMWIRQESRSDMRVFENEVRSWKEEINAQMKDFHGRLCAIANK